MAKITTLDFKYHHRERFKTCNQLTRSLHRAESLSRS